MADYGHSKNKPSRSSKDTIKASSRNKRHNEDFKHHDVDSKTPPLPARRSSIEDLIKQRESLKRELKKFVKHSEGDLRTSDKSVNPDKNRKNYSFYTLYSRKRCNSSQSYNEQDVVKTKYTKQPSPEHNGDYTQVESEDEESIIEKRRQQRKQLLEKYTSEEKHQSKEANMEQQQDNLETDNCFVFYHKQPHEEKTDDTKTAPVKGITDMFCDKDDLPPKIVPDHVTQDNREKNAQQLADNWDDSEGYYNIKVGDVINNDRYTIKSILGKGVFANVVRAQDNSQRNDVAIKIVRNNELMYITSLKEIELLNKINDADPENKYHCIKLFRHFTHKGHLCLVLEPLLMDLRGVIRKYGKHGLNIKALASYSRQMFVALRLLKKIGVVHGDIKPDNILVNEKKNVLKLCDFGSASRVYELEPTPYLVSRFYRAPEIILGIPYKHSADIWSAACTVYEMATGKIMFTGSSNNKMLKCFMDLKGKFPAKLLRRGKFKDQHFNYKNNFLNHKKDEMTGREKVVEVSNITVTRDLQRELKKFNKNMSTGDEKRMLQLKDILEKMLALDISQRLSVNDCLRHPFIQDDHKK